MPFINQNFNTALSSPLCRSPFPLPRAADKQRMTGSQNSDIGCATNIIQHRGRQQQGPGPPLDNYNDTLSDGVNVQGDGKKHTVHWFRKGLRLHDNPSLRDGLAGASTFRCVFVLDPWFAGSTNVSINKWR